jgi:transposase
MVETAVEILTGRERRRRWSVEAKLRIVAATYEPGACVRQVAASHDIYPGLLFTWRRQVRDGTLTAPPVATFVPVRTTAAALVAAPEHPDKAPPRSTGQIEIELQDGIRVRVDVDVSLAALRRVIAALRR